MTNSGRKKKGRKGQTLFAEALSAKLGLTIEASLPTQPGRRSNGARYIAEGGVKVADLKVRRMGEPGADVALVSLKAKQVCRFWGQPLSIECKRVEGWTLEKFLQLGRVPSILVEALKQTKKGDHTPCIVLSRNNVEPLVFLHLPTRTALGSALEEFPCGVVLRPKNRDSIFIGVPMSDFVRVLKERLRG